MAFVTPTKGGQFNRQTLGCVITSHAASPAAHLDGRAATGKQRSPLLFPVLLFKWAAAECWHLPTNPRCTYTGGYGHASLWLPGERAVRTSQNTPPCTILDLGSQWQRQWIFLFLNLPERLFDALHYYCRPVLLTETFSPLNSGLLLH